MSQPNFGSLDPTNLQEGSKVVIFSHELDNYSTLPQSLRRDFQIKSIRSWFLAEDDSADPVFAGLRFTEFLGRKVNGYYCPVTSLLASGDFEVTDGNLLRGTVIVQLVPDFESFRTMAKVLGTLYENEKLAAKGLWTDDALAQHVSEDSLLNVIGFCFCFPGMRNNPFPEVNITNVQESVRASRALLRTEEMWKFFQELRIQYSLFRLHENFFGFSNGINSPAHVTR